MIPVTNLFAFLEWKDYRIQVAIAAYTSDGHAMVDSGGGVLTTLDHYLEGHPDYSLENVGPDRRCAIPATPGTRTAEGHTVIGYSVGLDRGQDTYPIVIDEEGHVWTHHTTVIEEHTA